MADVRSDGGFSPSRPPDQRAPTPVAARERDIQRLSVLQGLLERMAGAPLDQLALRYAPALEQTGDGSAAALPPERKQAILDEFHKMMLETLGPMVLAVYEAQLKMGNLDAARDIGLSLGIIVRPTTAPKVAVQVNQNTPAPASSIEEYRLQRQTRAYRGPSPQPRSRMITPGSDTPS